MINRQNVFSFRTIIRTLCTFFFAIDNNNNNKSYYLIQCTYLIRKINSSFSCIIFNDYFQFMINLYFYIYHFTRIFRKKNQNIFYLSILKLIILLLFSSSIIFPRFNLIIIISFKFHLRSKYINQIYIFLYQFIRQVYITYMYSFYETHLYINPLQYNILSPELFLYRHENCIHNRNIYNLNIFICYIYIFFVSNIEYDSSAK